MDSSVTIRAVLLVLCFLILTKNGVPQKMNYILLWQIYQPRYKHMKRGSAMFANCSAANCYLTAREDYLGSILEFDAVVFSGMDIPTPAPVPYVRSEYQKYIFYNLGSSEDYPVYPPMDGFFNWTWTYRLGSDIESPFIIVRNKHGEVIGPKKNINWISYNETKPTSKRIKRKLQDKTRAAAWIVSQCETKSKREDFVSDLKQELIQYGLILDIYGKCGEMECFTVNVDECWAKIQSQYYFYLAFESTMSEDYVSQDLMLAVKHYTVPIVYGSSNYSRFMPPGMYLNAEELGVSALAREMKNIINYKDKYYDFFRWHRYYKFENPSDSPDTNEYCKLCELLNDGMRRKEVSIYKTLSAWWNTYPGKRATTDDPVIRYFGTRREKTKGVPSSRQHRVNFKLM